MGSVTCLPAPESSLQARGPTADGACTRSVPTPSAQLTVLRGAAGKIRASGRVRGRADQFHRDLQAFQADVLRDGVLRAVVGRFEQRRAGLTAPGEVRGGDSHLLERLVIA